VPRAGRAKNGRAGYQNSQIAANFLSIRHLFRLSDKIYKDMFIY
jgi:hypothetical protein